MRTTRSQYLANKPQTESLRLVLPKPLDDVTKNPRASREVAFCGFFSMDHFLMSCFRGRLKATIISTMTRITWQRLWLISWMFHGMLKIVQFSIFLSIHDNHLNFFFFSVALSLCWRIICIFPHYLWIFKISRDIKISKSSVDNPVKKSFIRKLYSFRRILIHEPLWKILHNRFYSWESST